MNGDNRRSVRVILFIVVIFIADATLTFETELVAVNKASPDIAFRVLRFFVLPFGAVFIVYYIYSKNRKGAPSKRDGRESLRRKKR